MGVPSPTGTLLIAVAQDYTAVARERKGPGHIALGPSQRACEEIRPKPLRFRSLAGNELFTSSCVDRGRPRSQIGVTTIGTSSTSPAEGEAHDRDPHVRLPYPVGPAVAGPPGGRP